MVSACNFAVCSLLQDDRTGGEATEEVTEQGKEEVYNSGGGGDRSSCTAHHRSRPSRPPPAQVTRLTEVPYEWTVV